MFVCGGPCSTPIRRWLSPPFVSRSIDGNEEVVAFVLLLKGASVTPSELMSYAGGRLTFYKRASQIIVLDARPDNSTGKILKHKRAESVNGA
ncbi:acyl-CoA synthetase (AMP-forming)/AMP-acid ligase II [Nitrobacteraceae bacterium AZCC 1564]